MSNTLKLFIETEKKYLENLELIDSKISPPWMKQFESVAPDFTELLKCIQDLISVNKPFYERLILLDDSRINFDDILEDLVNGMQSAYKSYTEHVINNLSKRQDILCTPSIHQFLIDNKDITLESLFYAPLYQLNFYKSLFNRPDITINQTTLAKANQLLDSLMIKNSLPPVDLDNFFSQLDYTKVVDILSDQEIPNYTLPTIPKVLLCNSFICTDISKRVQLVLSTDSLIFCSQDINKKDYLLYTPVQINNISIRTIHSDRELIGEYNMQLWVQKQKLFTLKSKSKQERNMWLGLDENSSIKDHPPSWIPLSDIVNKYDIRRRSTAKFKSSAPKPIRTTDFFTVFTEPSDVISPLVSSDEEDNDEEQSVKPVSKPLPAPVDKPLPQISKMPPLPRHQPKDQQQPAATRSLPVRNQSLKKPPIASELFLSPPEAPVRPPNVRSLSSTHLPKESSNMGFTKESPKLSPTPFPKELSKKSSFMRSVISAVSLKPNKKSSVDSLSNAFTTTVVEPPQHHLTIPSPQSPFANRSSLVHNQSTPSFTSINTSSQTSLNMTPPLSRSSSPGSMTPVRFSRYQSTSSSSSEDLGTPPESPEIMNHRNTIKQTLYSNQKCKVFHWKDESWYAVEEDCVLEVRQTFSNRSCVAVHMRQTGQFYLNAWILPDTLIHRTNETDLNLSLHIHNNQSIMENYLFHFENKAEADQLQMILKQMHEESVKMNMVISATSTVRGAPPLLARSSSLAANNTLTPEELAKTFKLAMQCKCKLYVQSASSKWSSFGSVSMKVSQQYATKKMHIAMDTHKGGKQLVSAMVQSNNVERLSTKRISFMMVDDIEKNSVVYMIQVREETTAEKILEYIKIKNAENGW